MKNISLNFSDSSLKLVFDKYAKLVNNSFSLSFKNTIFLVSSVFQTNQHKVSGFLNYKVSISENFFSINKIPTNYNRDEDKNSLFSVITSRLIDRSIRPLIESNILNQIQSTIDLFSFNNKLNFYWTAIFATSLNLYLTLGDKYFKPTGAIVLVYSKKEWKLELSENYINNKKQWVLISGVKTKNKVNITMIDYHGSPLTADELNKAVEVAKTYINQLIKFQIKIFKSLKKELFSPQLLTADDEVNKFISNYPFKSFDFSKTLTSYNLKKSLNQELENGLLNFKETLKKDLDDLDIYRFKKLFFQQQKEKIINQIIETSSRIDRRKFLELRKIDVEKRIFPSIHGSGLFERGLTQVLSCVTLSSLDSFKQLNSIDQVTKKYYFNSYHFNSFSTNQIKDFSGFSSRREIGHGQFVENVIRSVLPSTLEFPYVIRSVNDVLASDGSTSQASISATSIALLDAGVPLKEIVTGISIGLISKQKKEVLLLDINSFEDEIGLMDFKIAASEQGIRGVQVDVKTKEGIDLNLIKKILVCGYKTNLKLIDKIKLTIKKPNPLPDTLIKYKKLVFNDSNNFINKFSLSFKNLTTNSKFKYLKFFHFKQNQKTIIFLFHFNSAILTEAADSLFNL
ncbi:hypothetical protein [Mycoplasma sp. SG1]|uniref:hypothetical protein n=1 Tax=Mycoplasma sp. SG1 TaxID=2810348 RepID=UPI002024064E|nr:hypothetical protein [Mycoplasma sp. SG1]URM53219.1 hypothetical protein JRW51_02635 [Mycoplasma sp. SG1]